jgi:hypothetical protein
MKARITAMVTPMAMPTAAPVVIEWFVGGGEVRYDEPVEV